VENLNNASLIWSVVALATFIYLLYVSAPYGRHFKGNWGKNIHNKWGWVLMEAPSLIIMVYFLFLSFPKGDYYVLALELLWIGHYINRTVVFPLQLRTGNKKMPLIIILSGIIFNAFNASLNGYFLSVIGEYGVEWFSSWQFYTGLTLFLTGLFLNLYADHILIYLRKPGDIGYSIPEGWPFRLVSCPNYLGEIIEWTGFAIMAWNLPAFSFCLWSAANLIPRAMDHHKWYLTEFPNYPKSRKAILPFIL
jgi:hypothetical protein